MRPLNARGIEMLSAWVDACCERDVSALMPFAAGYESFRRFSCGGGYGVRDYWEISSRTFTRGLVQLGFAKLTRDNRRMIGGLRLRAGDRVTGIVPTAGQG